MSLTPGSRIGSYEIQSLLGEGGMGQVYKGRDTKLGRDVAIKVLPQSVANDPERLARFEREAKLLASLSHANIAQIYDIEDAGPDAGHAGRILVMELAPGRDLSLVIAASKDPVSGGMPFADVLPIAIQITQALEAAHERAIIHRDLKPANIKVSDDGAVKVLDFGLAKAFSPGDPSSASAMNSPTLTAQATAAGVILGTAAYMSPEQARGREADKRADVWAFGVVLFEMLTGKRLFDGETISDTLAAVLRQDIPWASLPAATPREIQKLLRRCLERDRKNRLHDISDARIVLEEVARGGGKEELPTATALPPPPKTPWLLIGGAAIAALIGGVFIGKSMITAGPAQADGSAPTVRFSIRLPAGAAEISQPAVSRDGSLVVFRAGMVSGGSRLYVQKLDEAAPKLIERTENGNLPFLSPDGRWLGFRQSGKLVKVALDGSEPLPITDIPNNTPGSVWLPNNTILFAKAWLGGISSVSSEGGAVRQVSTVDAARDEIGHWFPAALPNSGHVLITVFKKGMGINDCEIAVLDLTTGKHETLFKGVEGRYLDPGFIVYFRAGAFYAVRFDATTLKPGGEPVRVIDDAYGNSPEGDITQTDLNLNGTLAYLTGPNTRSRELTWIAAGGKTAALPLPARPYSGASITADGRRLAVSLVDNGRHVIHLVDLETGREDPLNLPGSSWGPRWHPDGKRLAYRSMQKGDFDIYWKDMSTGAQPEALLNAGADESPEAFMPKGDALIVEVSSADGQYRPYLMPIAPVGTPKPQPLTAENASSLSVSADGLWIAYISDVNGAPEAYVVPATGGPRERASTGGARSVTWSRSRPELFYLRGNEIVSVTFRADGSRLRRSSETVWSSVEGSYHDYVFEQGRDGRMLVAFTKEKAPREIRIVTNWATELARKVK